MDGSCRTTPGIVLTSGLMKKKKRLTKKSNPASLTLINITLQVILQQRWLSRVIIHVSGFGYCTLGQKELLDLTKCIHS
jgi:hypothetical protein